MTLDVIVVAYRSGAELRRCLGSVRSLDAPPATITLVNNDPADDLPAMVADECGALLLSSPGNVGFCRAVNAALATTTNPYVLLLNPDAGLTPSYVARLLEVLEADQTIAVAGGRLMRGGPSDRFIDSLGIDMRPGRRAIDVGHGTPDDGRRAGIVERFGVTAAAALYRRSALEAVAVQGEVLPESFFMYYDDVDLSWRFRLAGYRCVVDDRAVAWHGRRTAGEFDSSDTGVRRLVRKAARETTVPDYVRERSWVNHLLMLVRNDDPGRFLAQLPYYAARRLPGDVFGLVQRPAMAIRMRQRFLGQLPGAIRERREIQARRVVGAREMARWLP